MMLGKLAHIVRTLAWCLARPKLYPHFLYLLGKKIFSSRSAKEATRKEAESWCASLAVDTSEAIASLTGLELEVGLEALYPQVFASAYEQVEKCPVKMGGPGNLDLLYQLAEHARAGRIVETGVAYGWSSLALLLSLQHRPDGILISSDMPYRNRNNDRYVGCVVPAELRSRWRILRYADRQALPKALRELGDIDLCHYDSDKSYAGRMWAYPRLWDALRPGGYFVSDDIGDNVAFRDFAATLGIEPVVIRQDGLYVGVLVKPA
jgi:predicted O-methyltransferase YrrM